MVDQITEKNNCQKKDCSTALPTPLVSVNSTFNQVSKTFRKQSEEVEVKDEDRDNSNISGDKDKEEEEEQQQQIVSRKTKEKVEAQKPPKRNRKSKNDQQGRKYQCSKCIKSYLSAPALASHKKNKHYPNEEKKSAGRPKKYPSTPLRSKEELEKYNNFFNQDDRRINASVSGNDSLDALSVLFQQYNCFILSIGSSLHGLSMADNDITKIPLYEHLSKITLETSVIPSKDCLCVEDAFARYLLYCKSLSNTNYFKTVVNFVILFYDYYQLELEKGKEEGDKELLELSKKENQSETKDNKKTKRKGERKDRDNSGKTKAKRPLNAKTLPELSNYFILDYLPSIVGVLSEEETIDLMYHFCYFLHKNKYTTTVISIVN